MGKFRNLKDIRFGKLIAVELILDQELKNLQKSTKRNAAWLCKCDCGGKKIVASRSLLKGNTKSCGCLDVETKVKLGKLRGGYNKSPDSPARAVYRSYKLSARDRNKVFEISLDEFKAKTQLPCYYCGTLPNCCYRFTKYKNYRYNGIDRVDNTKGYISENCVPCCKICNMAKGTMTQAEFADWMCRVHGKWAKKWKDSHYSYTQARDHALEADIVVRKVLANSEDGATN